MKKILFSVIFSLLIILSSNAEVLRGSAVKDEIPPGFFGTWHVTSKLFETNNSSMFNPLSVDIWNLSGYGNVLILENTLTGAKSSIEVDTVKGGVEGKTLKFTRIREYNEGIQKIVHKESPEFVLDGDLFRGFDTFVVEKYVNNKLITKDVVKYKVIGQKISGESGIK